MPDAFTDLPTPAELAAARDLVQLAALDRLQPHRARMDAHLARLAEEGGDGMGQRMKRLLRRIGVTEGPQALTGEGERFRQATGQLWRRALSIATEGNPQMQGILEAQRREREAMWQKRLVLLDLSLSAQEAVSPATQVANVAKQVDAWTRPDAATAFAIGVGGGPMVSVADIQDRLADLRGALDRVLADSMTPAGAAAVAALGEDGLDRRQRLAADAQELRALQAAAYEVPAAAAERFAERMQAELRGYAGALRDGAGALAPQHRALQQEGFRTAVQVLARTAGEEPEAQRLVGRLADDWRRIERAAMIPLDAAPGEALGRFAEVRGDARMGTLPPREALATIPFMASSARARRRPGDTRPGF